MALPATRRPNVILLGMDSLRVDALGKGRTPTIDAFLERSVVFSDTLTPIARTFPAWVSIITGRHPHTTGATTNLMPRHLINAGQTLPMLLRQQGYASLYAIDDARFSNLDASFGFDHVVTPPMGATNFVLGAISDTPLSNILTDTVIGSLLFPFTHANRASALTYDPMTFIARIASQLPPQRPLLLASHFTLAHMPYIWSGQQYLPREADGSIATKVLYAEAIAGLDKQFAAYLKMLDAKGLLEDAIVVVFSDHGESLGERCPLSASSRCHLFGHGTSTMAPEQYQVVLGMRTFTGGKLSMPSTGRRASLPASLEDITPTIADLLHLRNQPPTDGRSLAAVLAKALGAERGFANRIRFVETEFNPKGFDGSGVLNAATLRRASSYYRVDAVTDRVTLRENEMHSINRNRERGAWRGGNFLLAQPTSGDGFRLVYSRAGAPLQKFADARSLTDPDAVELWDALRMRFPELTERYVGVHGAITAQR